VKRPPYSGLFRRDVDPQTGRFVARQDQIVCGRTFCRMCGRWRPISDFRRDRRNQPSGLRSYCHACDRDRRRRWWRAASPEQRQLVAEYRRFWRDAKRVEAGQKPRGPWTHSVVDHVERVYLDPAPLLALLTQYDTGDFRMLARRADLSEKAIYLLRYGKTTRVRLDHADKLALAMGSYLYDLYGDAPLQRMREARAA
jgi:hypothetical protein